MKIQRKSQKEYRCPWCKKIIPKGERYLNINNGKWHYHTDCLNEENKFCEGLVRAGQSAFETDYPSRI